MLRLIALLAPVFVTLFWAIILFAERERQSIPRSFLSRFMVLLMVLFTVKFFYYQPLPTVYPYFDLIHLYAGCYVFPVYHIYFRLLTIDEKFSWKAHARYLIFPTLLVTTYAAGVFVTPWVEYKAYLFDAHAFPDSPQVHFLAAVRPLISLYILLQVFIYLFKNFRLIRKYGARAEQFYSDIQDGKYNNAKMLNYMIVVNSAVTVICYMLFKRNSNMVILFPLLYAVVGYMIGYMGYKQKPINPTFDLEPVTPADNNTVPDLPDIQKNILPRLLEAFEVQKIYLNSQLNILQVVQLVGANRSYLSAVINRHYNQNFCSFVNGFRIEELHRVYAGNPDCSNEILAERCGFGSVNSLKRSVYAKTGMSITEWKDKVGSEQLEAEISALNK